MHELKTMKTNKKQPQNNNKDTFSLKNNPIPKKTIIPPNAVNIARKWHYKLKFWSIFGFKAQQKHTILVVD